MTVARILSSTATLHAARAYTPPGKTVADLFQLHNARRATVGLMLSALIGDDRLIRPPKVVTTTRPNRPRSTLAVKNRPSSRIHVFMRKRYGFGENFEATDRQLFQWNSLWRKWCPMV